jgi:hypothetical protein
MSSQTDAVVYTIAPEYLPRRQEQEKE